ncbi:MAG TPA: hypothetical protein VK158_06580 [Acidobacteriota bacterium]|nr:hypothetical protein [Acidobacteriota bacterium]
MGEQLNQIIGHNLGPAQQSHFLADPSLHFDFSKRLLRVQSIFNTHPLLAKKTQSILQMQPNDVIQLKRNVAKAAQVIAKHEPNLWSNVSFSTAHLYASHQEKPLEDEHRSFVKDNIPSIKDRFGNFFDPLHNAAISSHVAHSYADYEKFVHAVHIRDQLKRHEDCLNQQLLLLQKLDTKLGIDAAQVAPTVEQIKNSLADQQAILARLPPFRL